MTNETTLEQIAEAVRTYYDREARTEHLKRNAQSAALRDLIADVDHDPALTEDVRTAMLDTLRRKLDASEHAERTEQRHRDDRELVDERPHDAADTSDPLPDKLTSPEHMELWFSEHIQSVLNDAHKAGVLSVRDMDIIMVGAIDDITDMAQGFDPTTYDWKRLAPKGKPGRPAKIKEGHLQLLRTIHQQQNRDYPLPKNTRAMKDMHHLANKRLKQYARANETLRKP